MAKKKMGPELARRRALANLDAVSERIVGAADVLRALADRSIEDSPALRLVAESLDGGFTMLDEAMETLRAQDASAKQ